MPCSPIQLAKRELVSVILALAAQFGPAVQVKRDSSDKEVLAAYRALCRRVHPDKGGSDEAFRRLQSAKETWDEEKQRKGQRVP